MSHFTRIDPFVELRALHQQLFGDNDVLASYRNSSQPTTDVYDKGGALHIDIHLPGFRQEDIELNIEKGALTVQAAHTENETNKKEYVVRESSNNYYRRLYLPRNIDSDAIEAHFANGLLSVVAPYKEKATPKKITVKHKEAVSSKKTTTKSTKKN